MKQFKVVTDEGLMFEGSEEIHVLGSILELDPESEETKNLIENGYIVSEDVEKEPVVEEDPIIEEEIVAPVDVQSPTNSEPRKRYRGHVVLSDDERTVGVQTFQHIRLDDGSELDLTSKEYAAEVHVSYPPTA